MMRIMTFFRIVLLMVTGCFLFSNSYAADKKPIQLQLLGSTVGSGFHGGYHFNDIVFAGLDYSTFSLDQSSSDDEGTVTVELDFSTQVLLFRASPFSGSFYFQAGLVSRSWEAKATGVSEIGDSGQSGIVNAKVTFPTPAYALGFGWNWIASFGLSGGLGFGAIMGGDPDVDMTATSTTGATINQAEVEKEKKSLEDDMAAFANFPYIVGTIGWNF